MKRAFAAVIQAMALIGCLAFAGSFAGALHGLGDSLAVFRVQIGLATLIPLVLLRALGVRRAIWVAAVLVLAVLPPVWRQVGPQPGAQAQAAGITVYQKNMLYRLRDLAPLIADVRAVAPDILTLQEVTPANAAIVAEVGDILPTRLVCGFARVGAVAIAARWNAIEGTARCVDPHGLGMVRVEAPDGPLWLVSLHLHWPWPHGQANQVAILREELEKLDGPVVLAGDFNMVPWAHSYRAIARASRTAGIGRAVNSFPRYGPFLPLPIDHVLGPQGMHGATALRPLLGSDHHGVVARFR